jgi:hypothetical protein
MCSIPSLTAWDAPSPSRPSHLPVALQPRLRLLYLAGPFTAGGVQQMPENVERARAVALELWRMGAAVLSPHLNHGGFFGQIPEPLALDACLEMVGRCDALVILPGWWLSTGTRLEMERARRLGLSIFEWETQRTHLAAWLGVERGSL